MSKFTLLLLFTYTQSFSLDADTDTDTDICWHSCGMKPNRASMQTVCRLRWQTCTQVRASLSLYPVQSVPQVADLSSEMTSY